jgi:hypothetical protein
VGSYLQAPAPSYVIDQNVGIQQDVIHVAWRHGSSDPVPVLVEAVRLIAIRIGKVGERAERFVEHALSLGTRPLGGIATVRRQILIEGRANHFSQCPPILGAQLLDLAALLGG